MRIAQAGLGEGGGEDDGLPGQLDFNIYFANVSRIDTPSGNSNIKESTLQLK